MNGKSRVRVLYAENAIEFNAVFARMMADPRSDEYALLQTLRQDNPTFVIRKRCINKKPNQEHYRGLNYDYMRWYIRTHEEKETVKTVLDELENLILISQCHSKGKRYPVIREWFLDKYPEVREFGMPVNDASDDSQEAEQESSQENDITQESAPLVIVQEAPGEESKAA